VLRHYFKGRRVTLLWTLCSRTHFWNGYHRLSSISFGRWRYSSRKSLLFITN